MLFYSVFAGSRLNPNTIWGCFYFITIPCYSLYIVILFSHLKNEVGLNAILWEDDKYQLNLDVNVDLDVGKWNNRKVHSSICSMVLFVYEDLSMWIPGYTLERQERN